ncbi:MAG: nuclear transport factor 2 family protein [Candidatus Zixiibacteriota bacterium]|nr:MAG: nuclear transport factor 2 family protein [candidate division Zixibacteria bacterium]
MWKILQWTAVAVLMTSGMTSFAGDSEQGETQSAIAELEKAALTRWGNGDVFGYIELASEDISYFDPEQEKRLDGLAAFKELLVPVQGKIDIHRFEMPNWRVQLYGEVGILTFNLVNYDSNDSVKTRWNSTEVYHLENGEWKLVHSHWSLTEQGED